MIKLSDYVIKFITTLGVKQLFTLSGGGCMHLVDSIGANKKINYVCCLHEQAAAIAADGYAQYTQNIGAALVTTGPGGTNAITGVVASWIDSTPVMIISGQAKKKDLSHGKGTRQIGIQEVDISTLIKPVTKYAVTILEPESIRFHLEKAVFLAKTGRPGPVWIDIPLDVQGAIINEKKLRPYIAPKHSIQTSDRKVAKVISLINNSKRPAILAGQGIRLAHAEPEFHRLIRSLGIPVLTTWRTADFLSEQDPLYFGRPGIIASRGANFVQQNADLIICIGARLDLPQIGFDYKNFARHAKKIVIDIDIAELKKIATKIDVPIVADAKEFISKLEPNILKNKNYSSWLSQCQSWKNKYPIIEAKYLKPAKFVNTYALVETLSELLTKNDVIVPGSAGSASEITCQAFKIKRGQRFLNSPGLGSMGFGLPQSIGVCLASGKKRTICLIGDGGLQHNIQELETLKRLNLPIKLFVLNNNGYASIRNTHRRFFNGHLTCCDPSSGLTLPNTCKVADAYGLKTLKIANQRNLKQQVANALKTKGPVVCEVMVDPDLQTAPRLSSIAKPDGTMVSKPLEDLWPFLDPIELKFNMLTKSPKRKSL